MLNDISHLETWERVVPGLLRMYQGEVLGKLQVVQHLPFGTLLRWDD
jgi:serine/threonine-protein phosphatase 2A activator